MLFLLTIDGIPTVEESALKIFVGIAVKARSPPIPTNPCAATPPPPPHVAAPVSAPSRHLVPGDILRALYPVEPFDAHEQVRCKGSAR